MVTRLIELLSINGNNNNEAIYNAPLIFLLKSLKGPRLLQHIRSRGDMHTGPLTRTTHNIQHSDRH